MGKQFRKTKKIKKKRSILKSRLFWLGVGIAVFTELVLYIVVLLPLFQIQEVRVEGNTEVSENKIKSVVLQDLWKKLLFFPTASILLVDTRSMQDALLEAIPELATVSIQRKFPNILAFSLHERSTAALWCQPPHLIISGGGQELSCVAIDKEGVAFKEAHPSLESIIIYGQGQSLHLKEVVVTKDVLGAILDFAKEAKRRSLFLEGELSFEIVSENQIHARTGEGWSVYFTHTQHVSWQVTKLQTVLDNKVPPEKRRKLEYIDLRFGDQAYIKYR